jgi:polyisoprenoid-binding protein YceI
MEWLSQQETRLRRTLRLAPALLALFLATPVFAQQAVLKLDPGKTLINFTLGASFHTVHGTFRLKHGTITFDPATGQASGLVVVDATSGDTGNHGRDSKMHKEILESQKYPEITFTPVQIEGRVGPQGDSKVEVKGTFNLHGQDREIVLQAEVHIAGTELTADTNFAVPYVKWGLKNPSTFILRVSDTVQMSVHAAGQITMPAAK